MKAVRIIILITVLCNCYDTQGQDFKKDIESINATYHSATRFQMEMDYHLYPSHQSTNIFESTSALMIRDKQGYYAKMFEQETMINERYVILVDHDSKLFMIDRMQAGRRYDREPGMITNDSLLRQLQELTDSFQPAIGEVKSSPGAYLISFNYGELEQMEIQFDPAAHLFKKVVLYYRQALPILEDQPPQKPRLEIIYRKFNPDPNIPPAYFSEKKYAEIVPNKALIPRGKMKDYTIINHLWHTQANEK